MRNAHVFECMVAVKPLETRCQYLALQGPHEIAQGKALGHAAKHRISPEGAKYGSVQWPDLAGRKSLRAMSPFQGWNRVGIGFPGLRPGLSHSAPSGPGTTCVTNPLPLRFRGDDGIGPALRQGRAGLNAPVRARWIERRPEP